MMVPRLLQLKKASICAAKNTMTMKPPIDAIELVIIPARSPPLLILPATRPYTSPGTKKNSVMIRPMPFISGESWIRLPVVALRSRPLDGVLSASSTPTTASSDQLAARSALISCGVSAACSCDTNSGLS